MTTEQQQPTRQQIETQIILTQAEVFRIAREQERLENIKRQKLQQLAELEQAYANQNPPAAVPAAAPKIEPVRPVDVEVPAGECAAEDAVAAAAE
jgi:hypothetical protein